jgi:hypothetical protein
MGGAMPLPLPDRGFRTLALTVFASTVVFNVSTYSYYRGSVVTAFHGGNHVLVTICPQASLGPRARPPCVGSGDLPCRRRAVGPAGASTFKFPAAKPHSVRIRRLEELNQLATNERAIRLWQKLGFSVAGTLPRAFHHQRLGFVDALVMYKEPVT